MLAFPCALRDDARNTFDSFVKSQNTVVVAVGRYSAHNGDVVDDAREQSYSHRKELDVGKIQKGERELDYTSLDDRREKVLEENPVK